MQGLYIHIPFCSHLCSYCDFAKTANFNEKKIKSYFLRIASDLKQVLAKHKQDVSAKITSIYFGGGTPGLFTQEYEPLFLIFDSYRDIFVNEKEVTLEVNPNDIQTDSLLFWKTLGINRLSIGVQTFNEKGLKFLGRDHSAKKAFDAVELASRYFKNINMDLIYGWSGQTSEQWQEDLEKTMQLPVTHISAYSLTYEDGTILGKKLRRNLVAKTADDFYEQLYRQAYEFFKRKNFKHEEVSNWYLQGFEAQHNALYWRMKPYIALGIGAHGFDFDHNKPLDLGQRYFFSKNEHDYLQKNMPAQIDERDAEGFILECLATGLRTIYGVDLNLIQRKTNKIINIDSEMEEWLKEQSIVLKNHFLFLNEQEWFREQSWVVRLSDKFYSEVT